MKKTRRFWVEGLSFLAILSFVVAAPASASTTISTDVSTGGTLSVSGASTLTGNAALGGTLGVTGATTLSSTLGVSGALAASSTLQATGASRFYGTLLVDGAATFSSNATVAGLMTANNIQATSTSALNYFLGKVGFGTTTPYAALSVEGASALGNSATAGYFTGTTTATSTLAGGLNVLAINQTGTATSTFAKGIDLSAGCFSILGSCIGGGGGSQTPWLTAINGGGFALSNAGTVTATDFQATSTSATSTFLGDLAIGTTTANVFNNATTPRQFTISGGAFPAYLNLASARTSGDQFMGGINFINEENSGHADGSTQSRSVASIYSKSQTGGSLAGGDLRFFTKQANSALDLGSPRLMIDHNGYVGVASSSPGALFSVAGNAYFTGGIGLGSVNTGTGIIFNGDIHDITTTGNIHIGSEAVNSSIVLKASNSDIMKLDTAGNVGIGMSNFSSAPNTKLEVVGTASSTALVVGSGSTFNGMIRGTCTIDGSMSVASQSTSGRPCLQAAGDPALRTTDAIFVSATTTASGASPFNQPLVIKAAIASSTAGYIDVFLGNFSAGSAVISPNSSGVSLNYYAIR